MYHINLFFQRALMKRILVYHKYPQTTIFGVILRTKLLCPLVVDRLSTPKKQKEQKKKSLSRRTTAGPVEYGTISPGPVWIRGQAPERWTGCCAGPGGRPDITVNIFGQ